MELAELSDCVDCRLFGGVGGLVEAVEVLAQEVHPVVSVEHAVRI